MPRDNSTNPWADATNQAVGALYKYYMSQPTAADIQAQQLKNDLLQSQLQTQELSRQNMQSQMGERNFDLGRKKQQSAFADLLAREWGDVPAVGTESPMPDNVFGPGPVTTRQMRDSKLAGLLERYAPKIDKDTITSARDALGTASALTMFDDPVKRQLALDEKGTSYDSYSSDYTLSPGSVRFDADNKQIASAPFKTGGGSYIQQPDGTVISIDGGMPPLRGNVAGQLQEKDISFDTYRTFSDNMRKEVMANPQSVGTRGNIARLADGVLGQVNSLAPDSPLSTKLNEIVNVTAGQYTDPATGQIMNKDLYSAATLSAILPFVAAEAIVGQGGRSLSNEDRELVASAIGSPENWLATPDRLVSRLNQLDNVVNQLRVKYQGRLAGTRPMTPPPNNDPLSIVNTTSTGVKWKVVE